jgi:hypothetical protein
MNARALARIAGALYLLSAIAAGAPLIFVPSHFIVDGNAAATAAAILHAEMLFGACILSELTGAVLLLFAARALRRLFMRLTKGRRHSWSLSLFSRCLLRV